MTTAPVIKGFVSAGRNWKVVSASVVVLSMPIVGEVVGELIQDSRLLELIEAVPAIACALFIFFVPQSVKPTMRIGVRLACLTPLLLLLFFGLGSLPVNVLGANGTTALIVANAMAIGVTEELTFRYSLHRLWIRYGASLYVVLSSLIFGLMHYPGGIIAIGITTLLGAIFGMARIAGTPVLLLVIIHGLIDLPEMTARFTAIPAN